MNDQDKKKSIYKAALELTQSNEDFNPEALKKLAETIDDRDLEQKGEIEKIKVNLSATLNDDQLVGQNIDFQYDETASEDIDDPDVNEFLEANVIPGRYRIKRLLGSGNSGQVFSVYDNNLYRKVAAKFMHPSDLDSEEKTLSFIGEARITANLDHPNILPVHDLNYTDGGLIYFTMDEVEGTSLQSLLDQYEEKNVLPDAIESVNERINIMLQVCNAIAYAHSHQIIHNDIKPSNVMIGAFGEVLTVDWGTACSEDLAKTHAKYGTPLYMSPEQAKDHKSDHRSDIYCLGTTLFHLLTLRVPCWHDDIEQFWKLKCDGYYNPPTAAERKRIPKALLSIAEKAMAVDPDARYQQVTDMIADIEAYQADQSISAYTESPIDLIKRLYRHNKKAIAAGICGIVVIAIIAAVLIYERAQSQKAWLHHATIDFDNIHVESLENDWEAFKLPEYKADRPVPISFSDKSHWSIQNGKLHFDAITESCIYNLLYKHRFAGNMRINFDYTPHHDGGNVNCFIAGPHRVAAYTFHIGGWGDLEGIRITKPGANIAKIKLPFRVTKDTTYNIQMERDGNYIRLYVNGKLYFNYKDPDVLIGLKHQQFGIDLPTDHSSLDNIKIYYQPLPQKISPLSIANAYYNNGLYEEALQTYRNIRDTYGDAMKSIALYRIGRCLTELGETKKASYVYGQFSKLYPEHELMDHVTVQYISQLSKQNDWDGCSKTLHKYKDSIKDPGLKEVLLATLSKNLLKFTLCRPDDYELSKKYSGVYYHTVSVDEYKHRMRLATKLINEYAADLGLNYDVKSSLLYEHLGVEARVIGDTDLLFNELRGREKNIYRYYQYLGEYDKALQEFPEDNRYYAYSLLNSGRLKQYVHWINTHPRDRGLNYHNTLHAGFIQEFIELAPDVENVDATYLYFINDFQTVVEKYAGRTSDIVKLLPAHYQLGQWQKVLDVFETGKNLSSMRDLKLSILVQQNKIDAAKTYAIKGSQLYGELLLGLAYQQLYTKGDASQFKAIEDNHPMYIHLHRMDDRYLLRPFNQIDSGERNSIQQHFQSLAKNEEPLFNDKHRLKLRYLSGLINAKEYMDYLRFKNQDQIMQYEGNFNLLTGMRLELEGKGKEAIKHYKTAQLHFYDIMHVQFLEWRIKQLSR